MAAIFVHKQLFRRGIFMSCLFSPLLKRAVCWLLMFFATFSCFAQKPGESMPEWKEGILDIHHINTGRGNSSFVRMPDGTTLLIDAGELSPLDARTFTPRNAALVPDSSRKPYEWIVDYIKQAAPGILHLDYAMITHYHDDHFGAWYPSAPRSSSGKFIRTGITGVGDILPVKTLFDRGAPGYSYPYDLKESAKEYGGGEVEFGETMKNYFLFIDEMKQKGMKLEKLRAGSNSQVVPITKPGNSARFVVQNIKVNGECWTGKDSSVLQLFPQYKASDRSTWPDENALSLAMLIQYGPFRYYTGGDNPGMLFTGTPAWRDVETPIAKAIGQVDVATMDHHGNRDAVNENQIKTLQPRVWVGQSWSSDHPGHEVLIRIMNQHLYKGPRDLFATNMLESNRLVIGPAIDHSYKSQQGHIMLRVTPGGNEYYIIILDDNNPERKIESVFGPYTSKGSIK